MLNLETRKFWKKYPNKKCLFNMKNQLKQTEHQKIIDKIHRDIYAVITKAGFEMVEHKEDAIFASSQFKSRKITVSVKVS